MPTLNVFRILVIASVAIAFCGGFLDLVVPEMIPKSIDDAYNEYLDSRLESIGGMYIVAIALGVFIILLSIATFGMLKLKRWGRSLAFGGTIITFPALPALGVLVQSGWANMLSELSISLWAAAITIAYFSELKTQFE